MTWQGLYINLDRSETRRAAIEAQLHRVGLSEHYQRFAAVDGRGLSPPDGASSAAELACYMSHLEVMRRSTASGRWLHVLEDDTILSRHAGSAIGLVTSSQDCARYDIIFTNVTLHAPNYVLAQFCRLYDENVQFDSAGQAVSTKITVVPMTGREFVTASSYLVNPASIGKVAELLRQRLDAKPFAPVDIAISNLSMAGVLSVGCTIPFFSLPRWDIESTIRDWEDVRTNTPLLLAGEALFVDRDANALRRQLDAARRLISPTTTSALVADACALVLSGWLIDKPSEPAG